MCLGKGKYYGENGLVSADHPTHWLGLHIRERLLTSIITRINPGEANTFSRLVVCYGEGGTTPIWSPVASILALIFHGSVFPVLVVWV